MVWQSSHFADLCCVLLGRDDVNQMGFIYNYSLLFRQTKEACAVYANSQPRLRRRRLSGPQCHFSSIERL